MNATTEKVHRTLNATLRLQNSRTAARDSMTTSTGISLIEYITSYAISTTCTTYACNICNICIHHEIFIQHKRSLRIMTVYIIFTINILHICLGMHGSSTSVAFCTFWPVSKETVRSEPDVLDRFSSGYLVDSGKTVEPTSGRTVVTEVASWFLKC